MAPSIPHDEHMPGCMEMRKEDGPLTSETVVASCIGHDSHVQRGES